MNISVQFNAAAFVSQLDDLELELDRRMLAGIEEAAERVALHARESHPYQNRTGNLEASTRVTEYGGTFTKDHLYAIVAADAESNEGTQYGSFVEENHGLWFLGPAYEAASSEVERILDETMAAAARAAGL